MTGRRTIGNKVFSKGGHKCFVETFVLNQAFQLLINFNAENPQHHKLTKRFLQLQTLK